MFTTIYSILSFLLYSSACRYFFRCSLVLLSTFICSLIKIKCFTGYPSYLPRLSLALCLVLRQPFYKELQTVANAQRTSEIPHILKLNMQILTKGRKTATSKPFTTQEPSKFVLSLRLNRPSWDST